MATDELINSEPTVYTTMTVRLRDEKPGDIGRHQVRGLRGYTVMRLRDKQERQQFAFSTLSAPILSRLGASCADRD